MFAFPWWGKGARHGKKTPTNKHQTHSSKLQRRQQAGLHLQKPLSQDGRKKVDHFVCHRTGIFRQKKGKPLPFQGIWSGLSLSFTTIKRVGQLKSLQRRYNYPSFLWPKVTESDQAESLYKVYQIHASFSQNAQVDQFLHN